MQIMFNKLLKKVKAQFFLKVLFTILSTLVAVANNDDAGRIDIADALFKVLPESIVNAALGGQKPEVNKNQVQNIDPAKGTEECRRRCNIS
jgi:hypothetical protein